MPITFTVAKHQAKRVVSQKTATSPQNLLQGSWGKANREVKCAELLQSSMGSGRAQATLKDTLYQRNGFVDTVIDAYNKHHHLIIRPDDIWIAILGQFNFYVNANAEELRSYFVAHEGQRELIVQATGSNRYTVDFGAMANQMSAQIDKNLVDKDMKNWILPDFTTTTHNDTVISSVIMMATFKAYFTYRMDLLCGIPSVTLEGEKADYEKILARLDKLSEFGPEPKFWAIMLRSIVSRFVSAFDQEPDPDFWRRICDYSEGSGAPYISGWITAFCVWKDNGRWIGPALSSLDENESSSSEESLNDDLDVQTYMARLTRRVQKAHKRPNPRILDGIEYRSINLGDVPVGFCEVDVKLNDNGLSFDCLMVAGHVASAIEGNNLDTLRPSPAWFMFIKG